MAEGLFWGLLALVWLAPLPLGANRPWGWGLLGLGIGALLVMFAAAAYLDRELVRLDWRRYGALAVGWAIVILWGVLQQSGWTPADWHDPLWGEAEKLLGVAMPGAMTLDPDIGRQSLLHLLTYGGIFLLAIHFGRSRRRARLVLWSLASAGAAYAAYGLIMQLGGFNGVLWYEKWSYPNMVTSTFVNRNSFATYAGITLIATLALFLKETEGAAAARGNIDRGEIVNIIDNASLGVYVLVTSAIAIVTALLLSQSRAGFGATVVGVIAFAAAMRFARRRRGAATKRPIFGMVLGAAFVILVVVSGGGLMGRLANLASPEVSRDIFYAMTLEEIGEHPLAGTGLGSYHGEMEMVRDDRLDDFLYTVDRAHNSYLELALELGLPVFVVLLATLAGIAIACLRGLVLRERDVVYPAAGIGATALVALHSTLDFSLQIPAVSAAYALLMGAAFAQSFPTRQRAAGRALSTLSPVETSAPGD